VSANLDQRTLREVYLPHFRRAVEEAGVASVMSAYNRVNGVHCGEHPELLAKILKGEWGFQGFVESDWILGTHSTVASALAGLDIEMPSANHYGAPLVDAVGNGSVPRTVIDAAVRRILRQKACFAVERRGDPAVVESREHVALAREVAEKAIVLLKNERGALPLSLQDLPDVVVVGKLGAEANLGDHGSSSVTPTSAVSPLQGLSALSGGQIAAISSDEPSDELEKVRGKVAVVVVGLTYLDEGEFIPIAPEMGALSRGGDRASLDLSETHQRLIQNVAVRATRTIVVLEGGSAIVVQPWLDSVDALLMAWYPGMEGGNALAGILIGDVNPSGKLPVTFPRTLAQLPFWDIESKEVDYGYFHGYRLLDRNSEQPEFPFGFGLSYTVFALGRLRLERSVLAAGDSLKLAVDVYNKGDRTGDEVVQAYVGYTGSTVDRPRRELKGFQRVSLDPGEVKTVKIEFPISELSYYDVAAARFVVEPIGYQLEVGTSSRELPLKSSFSVR
jgi:beta-glucosidase